LLFPTKPPGLAAAILAKKGHGTAPICRNYDSGKAGLALVETDVVESVQERRTRYTRMAIAAAAAAARAPLPEVRMAYLLLAESWSNLAKVDEEQEAQRLRPVTPMDSPRPPEVHR